VQQLPNRVKVLIFLLIALFISFFLYTSFKFKVILSKQEIVLSVVLSLSILISDRFPVIVPIGTEISALSVSSASTFALAFLFNPFITTVIVFINSILTEIISKRTWYKMLFNTANISFSTGVVSLFFWRYYNKFLPFTSPYNIGIVISGALLHFTLESIFLYLLLSFIVNRPLLSFYLENVRFISLEVLTLYPLGVIITYFFKYNPIMNAFLLPSLIAVYYALERRYILIQETKNALFAIAEVVDKKIPDTIDHAKRVATITEAICNELKLPLSQTNEIILAAMLHDIGKIVIPDSILKKPDPNEEEMRALHSHAIEGEKVVGRLPLFRNGAILIRHHHERWDGTGYPDHLKGEEIPLGSRIIAIADSFDAMTTQRYYRDRVKTFEEGLQELTNCSGTQFDPNLVDIATKVIREFKEKLIQLTHPSTSQ